jgi:hypothetical protein
MGVVGGMDDGTVCSDSPVSFGKQMRERYFLFEKSYINLNHGEQFSPDVSLTLSRLRELEARLLIHAPLPGQVRLVRIRCQ